ncbi:MAG: lytic transglycosylase [Spirochaetes bacterium]|nr:MAG: lytic transglycosylase [Spirochaetota bacterium]
MRKYILLVLILPVMLTFTDFVVATKNMDTVKTANSQEVEVLTGLPAMTPVNPGSMPVDLSLQEDLGLYLYRNPVTRQRVIDYFTGMTGSRQLTDIILRYSDINNLPLSLSFALAYAESSFNPSAVNRNSASVDRGLFQLNSRSFPRLSEAEFFDPEINTRLGLSYLRDCLEQGGNVVVGLAMYNAGRTRVKNQGTPRMTLDYIAKIMSLQSEINTGLEGDLVKTRVVNTGTKQKKTVKYVLDTGKYSK